MKLLLAAFAAAVLSAQDAPKPEAPKPAPPKPVAVKTRALTEEQHAAIERLQELLKATDDNYELQKRLAKIPLQIELNALITDQCTKMGIPKAKIDECETDLSNEKGDGFGEVRWMKPPKTPENTK